MENKEQLGRSLKRMNLEIPESLHNEIKARAAIRGMTMTEYVIAILAQRTIEEKFYE